MYICVREVVFSVCIVRRGATGAGECFVINSQYFEGLIVTLKTLSYSQFIIVVIYRPPSAQIQSFLDPFNSVLQETYGKNVIICGDFNIQ